MLRATQLSKRYGFKSTLKKTPLSGSSHFALPYQLSPIVSYSSLSTHLIHSEWITHSVYKHVPVTQLSRYETPLYTHPNYSLTHFVFRGDYRSLEHFQSTNGIHPAGKNLSVVLHMTKEPQKDSHGRLLQPLRYAPSGYVSTTRDYSIAQFFADITGKNNRYIFAIQRTRIIIAPVEDVQKKFKMQKDISAVFGEQEMPTTHIPLSDIAGYKLGSENEIFSRWLPNPQFIPANFSIMVRSCDPEEAKRFSEGLPYFYPSYQTALDTVPLLQDCANRYSDLDVMVCFEKLTEETVEKRLNRRPGSGFSESDLPRYYVETFNNALKNRGQKTIFPMTFFGKTCHTVKIEKTNLEVLAQQDSEENSMTPKKP